MVVSFSSEHTHAKIISDIPVMIVSIFDRSTFLHLRLPFSFFLLPVFCFALSQAEHPDIANTILIFVSLHFFIYPASNLYNSYMDNDKGSIGALKNPPPATKKLYHASILFDGVGLLLGALISWKLIPLLAIYVGVSKAYSWHGIRLKKYPYSGWLAVMLFQGGYTYMLASMCIQNLFDLSWFSAVHLQAFLLSSFLIGGFYPLTQIYQHKEDSSRGDYTISYRLGVRGTFIFCSAVFCCAFLISTLHFTRQQLWVFATALFPIVCYFSYWAAKTFTDASEANYRHAMRITFLSSLCMTSCFLLHLLLRP